MPKFKKGFTLIELLVVIGIMAVLAAGVVALIDPVDKTIQAYDAKIMNDVGQIATAMQSYAAQNSGSYPTTITSLSPGELVVIPAPPSTSYPAYAISTTTSTGGYTNDTTIVYNNLKAKRNLARCTGTSVPYWVWISSQGKSCVVCSAAAPTASSTCTWTP